MAREIKEGDAVTLEGYVTRVNGDGTITVRVSGYALPMTISPQSIASHEPQRPRKIRDQPDD